MRHAHPAGAPGRGVVRALRKYPLTQVRGQADLRHRVIRGRPRAAARRARRFRMRGGSELPQAFVPRERVQPGAQLIRIAQPGQLGGGDDEGVCHGVGGRARPAGVD